MMILSILAIAFSAIAITVSLTVNYQHQRHLNTLSKRLEICDRRLSANHDSIMDLYNRANRIESKQ
jgi:uncharacterized protein YoxC